MNDITAQVLPYRNEWQPHFERLNREWIETHFVIEEADRIELSTPYDTFIVPGGQIFFVVENTGEVMGTCAISPHHPHQTEELHLSKMAVAGAARGRGYGDLLMQTVIQFARDAGARSITLVSNRKLAPAMRLYAKHGFREVPLDADENYQRADIKMRLDLPGAGMPAPG